MSAKGLQGPGGTVPAVPGLNFATLTGELVWGREGEWLLGPVLPAKTQPALIQGMG